MSIKLVKKAGFRYAVNGEALGGKLRTSFEYARSTEENGEVPWKYFHPFERLRTRFLEVDSPSELCSALGHLALAFAGLDLEVDGAIAFLLGEELGAFEDLAFPRRAEVLGDLLLEAPPEKVLLGSADVPELATELVQYLKCAYDAYREYMDPDLMSAHLRAQDGGPEIPESVTDSIMYASDFVTSVLAEVEEIVQRPREWEQRSEARRTPLRLIPGRIT